jgi:hypothetical protein
MADRPGLYRGIRLGDAAALTAAAAALFLSAGAEAQVKRVKPGADPSASGGDFVNQHGQNRAGELRRGSGPAIQLPGTDPAVGGAYIAVLDGSSVELLDRTNLDQVDRVDVAGADAVAVSGTWLAIRSRVKRRDQLQARPIRENGAIGPATGIAAAGPPAQLGRPSLAGDRLAYAVAKPGKNKVVVYGLENRDRRTIMRSRKKALSNASIYGKAVLYVRSKRRRDDLMIRKLGKGGARKLTSRKARLWSTALTAKRAYVTVLEGREPRSRIVSVKR